MTRVVIDTNVLISALLTETGSEATVISLVRSGQIEWFVSEAILAEYHEVIQRPKFSAIRPDRIKSLIRTLNKAVVVVPIVKSDISPDEPDNRFLECAEAAKADFLVTGNKKHFRDLYEGTSIVNAREFLQRLS
jgi:putative PIN family toxin of toxin-antitoxin system